MTTQHTTLTGHDAIAYADQHGLELSKYADPIEGSRDGLTVDEAREIASVDPSLVYLELSAEATRWTRFRAEADELDLRHSVDEYGVEWIRLDDHADLVYDGERIEIAEGGVRCPCAEPTVAAAWLATAKARWEACGALRDRVDFEDRYLSTEDALLSDDAIAVRDGGEPTPTYYAELVEQWAEALRD